MAGGEGDVGEKEFATKKFNGPEPKFGSPPPK